MSNDVPADYNAFENYDRRQDERRDSLDLSFPAVYDRAVAGLAQHYGVSAKVQEILKEKRAFGLKKYGDRSFQSNLENALTTPIWNHLHDELVDAVNYSLHYLFVLGITGGEEARPQVEGILKSLLDIMDNQLVGIH